MHCKDAPRYVSRKFHKSLAKQFLEIAIKQNSNIPPNTRLDLQYSVGGFFVSHHKKNDLYMKINL